MYNSGTVIIFFKITVLERLIKVFLKEIIWGLEFDLKYASCKRKEK